MTTKAVATRQTLPVQVGPWPGGLNNREADLGYRSIKPTELLRCSNFDVKESGMLINRPGFASFNLAYFTNKIGGVSAATRLRNVMGPTRLDRAYDEALVQVYDPNNLFMYLLRGSLPLGGEQADFDAGYWVRKAVTAGADFFITDVVRYHSDLYYVTNNGVLNESSTFTGGFFNVPAVAPVSSIFATAIGTLGGSPTSLDNLAMAVSSTGILYLLSHVGANTLIHKITTLGVVTLLATLAAELYNDMCCDGTDLFLVGNAIATPKITKVTAAGVVSTLATASGTYSHLNKIVWNPNNSTFQVSSTVLATGFQQHQSVTHVGVFSTYGPVDNINGFYDTSMTVSISNNATRPYYNITPGSGPNNLNYFSTTTVRTLIAANAAYTYYVYSDVTSTANDYVFVTDFNASVWRVNAATGAYSLYMSGFNGSSAMAQDAAGNLYVYESGTDNIIKITPTSIGALTAIPTMPFGDIGFMFKDRMWIVNKVNNELFYSKATDPTDWATIDNAGFFFVNPGDGQSINDVVVVNNQMFIFKDTGTWVFTFTTDPAVDGVLRVLSADRGAYSACAYNNVVYVVGTQGVQKILNGFFVDVAQQIKDFFPYFTTASIIDCIHDKLYVTLNSQILTGLNINVLSMNLLSGAWSTYDITNLFSTTSPFPIQGHISRCGTNSALFLGVNNGALVVGGISNFSSDNVVAGASAAVRYMPYYQFITGYLDFDTPLLWKKFARMYVDLISTFPAYESIAVPYPLPISASFFSPTKTDIANMNLRVPAGAGVIPSSFPVQQLINDVSTGQVFAAHRFAAMTLYGQIPQVTLNNGGVGGNQAQLVIRKLHAYVTQRSSQLDGISIT